MKKINFVILLLLLSSFLFSFDWPLSSINKDSFKSYFGQIRGNKLNTSLIFKDPDEVKAADDGRILTILTEQDDDSDFFPSTLGTAVILSHEDNLISVYGNLAKDTLTLNDVNEITVESGTILGSTGNSGWQSDTSSLEFQIIDIKDSSSINPKILMSRLESENKYILSDITLQNKNGTFFPLSQTKTFPSGLYKIYQKRNAVITPVKTSVLFNGVVVDELSYNTITQENGKNCIIGKKKKYTSENVYPQNEYFLLGEAVLTPGKITLGIITTDALGQTNTLNYMITTY